MKKVSVRVSVQYASGHVSVRVSVLARVRVSLCDFLASCSLSSVLLTSALSSFTVTMSRNVL